MSDEDAVAELKRMAEWYGLGYGLGEPRRAALLRAVWALDGGLARAYDQGLADGLAVRDGPSCGHTAPSKGEQAGIIPEWWDE